MQRIWQRFLKRFRAIDGIEIMGFKRFELGILEYTGRFLTISYDHMNHMVVMLFHELALNRSKSWRNREISTREIQAALYIHHAQLKNQKIFSWSWNEKKVSPNKKNFNSTLRVDSFLVPFLRISLKSYIYIFIFLRNIVQLILPLKQTNFNCLYFFTNTLSNFYAFFNFAFANYGKPLHPNFSVGLYSSKIFSIPHSSRGFQSGYLTRKILNFFTNFEFLSVLIC